MDENEEEADKRRHSSVKRACNQCRQQKLRCDVVQDPFTVCSRCARLNLECKIELHFRRIGKRSRHAELEREVVWLRQCLSQAKARGYDVEYEGMSLPSGNYSQKDQKSIDPDDITSLHINTVQSGSYHVPPSPFYELEDVVLTEATINSLVKEFWTFYHPFLMFLCPSQLPNQYYEQHPLLFWTIIAVAARRHTAQPGLLLSLTGPITRLLWNTIGEVPNNHFVVKALCIMCTWPLPISITSSDPTHILCGIMMKVATGIGLHRPMYTQEFSRVSIQLDREQLFDRLTTWTVCNIVAQRCGTGYGQPASTLYDWTQLTLLNEDASLKVSSELEAHLKIERFCDKVSKEMYSNASDPRGETGEQLRAALARIYRREYRELQSFISSRDDVSPLTNLYLAAAGLHLCLSVFFDSSTTKSYMDDLMELWRACIFFLQLVFELDTPDPENQNRSMLFCATNYLLQMIVAACFTLLKFLDSFFAPEIDYEFGTNTLHRTIQVIRAISVFDNDLPCRLANLMMQMWGGAHIKERNIIQRLEIGGRASEIMRPIIDDSLQLNFRCRMSMSLVFDSIWRWRKEYQMQEPKISYPNTKNIDQSVSANTASTSTSSHIKLPINQEIQFDTHALDNADSISYNITSGYDLDDLGNMENPGPLNFDHGTFYQFDWALDRMMNFPYNNNQGVGDLDETRFLEN
ncbi:putative zn2 cys6 dna-binding protein [Erysiphe necator]|uniref:Putative zn2 cys6 dna-binding protein n=1 Tax=Uncinula necator TaxID=52586 RepID=A0A0B1P7S5_UNCNE|nr:putative zn2 cys6 dna-binding protein [Erysiphe necator]